VSKSSKREIWEFWSRAFYRPDVQVPFTSTNSIKALQRRRRRIYFENIMRIAHSRVKYVPGLYTQQQLTEKVSNINLHTKFLLEIDFITALASGAIS